MRKLLLVPAVFLVILNVACGSGNGNSSGSGGFGSGGSNGFSLTSLSGQYAYQVSGFDFNQNQAFRESGVFTADGKGNITSGTDDLAEGSSVFSDPFTGSYSLASDGTGSANLIFSSGSSITFALSVATSSKVFITVPLINGTAQSTGSGIALKQDTTAIAGIPSGNYAFGLHTVGSTLGSSSVVGGFAVSGGVISGNEDLLQAGSLSSHTLTGLFNTPDSSGRGTATFTNEASATSTYNYYIIDANNFFLFSTVNGAPGIGSAAKQSTTSFDLSSLTGSYAFGSRGDTTAALDSVNSAGRFSASGTGAISAGLFDSVQDGTVASNIGFTGNYTVDADGRADLHLVNSSTAAVFEQVAWLVSPTRAFFLFNDPGRTEDGTFMAQQSSGFSNASLNGNFAFFTDGFNTTDSFDRLGTMNSDGAGNLKLDYVLTEPSLTSQTVSLTGTIAVNSSGRAVANVANLSPNLIIYLISSTDGFIVQADSGTQMAGGFSKQQ